MRLACVQSDVEFNDPGGNAERAAVHLRKLKSEGVDFVVFPEAFLTGYCVATAEDADSISLDVDPLDPESSPEPSVHTLIEACHEVDLYAVVGFAGRDDAGLYNGVLFCRPGEAPVVGKKTHLPILGLDNFVQAGDAFTLVETRFGKVGVLICFDLRAPEPSRILALRGADLIVLPTNWPNGAQMSAEHIIRTRAAENKIFYASCNRVGEENGFGFIGMSKIVDPMGQILAAAGDGEEVIVAEIDLAASRAKRNVTIPGKYEVEIFASRRPDLYADLTKQ